LYAPGPGSDIPNINSIYFAIIPSGGGSVQVGGPNTAELPPGATAVIDIQDVKDLYFVSQNLTDVVTGFVEANL
jgi:acyl CoA:acetate/3-ketoacid CoA transferase alpha subunit